MRKGTIQKIPDTDIFHYIEFSIANFAGGIILCTTKNPFGPTIGWRLKPYQSPVQVSLCQEKLFGISPGTPNHVAQMPKVIKMGISQSRRLLYPLGHPS